MGNSEALGTNCKSADIPGETVETIKLKLVWETSLSNLGIMFFGLDNLIKVDFSNFDSSFVINMEQMFRGCKNLSSINFANFNTEKVQNMFGLFYECQKLVELDLSSLKLQKSLI